jgi:hypothetical protein
MTPRDVLLWDHDLPWSQIGSAHGAAHVPQAIADLATATSEEAAESAYWRLDNSVVLQGSVFEAGAAVVPAIARALVAGTAHCQRWSLDLLLQIAGGWTEPSEFERTGQDFAEEARATMRPLLPVLLGYAAAPTRDVRETALELCRRLSVGTDAEEDVAARLRWLTTRVSDDERAFYEGLLREP